MVPPSPPRASREKGTSPPRSICLRSCFLILAGTLGVEAVKVRHLIIIVPYRRMPGEYRSCTTSINDAIAYKKVLNLVPRAYCQPRFVTIRFQRFDLQQSRQMLG